MINSFRELLLGFLRTKNNANILYLCSVVQTAAAALPAGTHPATIFCLADEKEKENEDDEVEDEAVTEQRRIEMVRNCCSFSMFFSLSALHFRSLSIWQ